MSTVKEVLIKYNKIVKFPWSISKIVKASKNPTEFLLEVGYEIGQCTDVKNGVGRELLSLLKDMEMML